MKDLRTIVGGRSRSNRLVGEFPRGIEILLKKARVDVSFRERLLKDPLSAAASISLVLTEQEVSILRNTPRSLVAMMVSNTRVLKQHVPIFKTAKTAAVLALALGTTAVVPSLASAGIEEPPSASIEQLELARQRMAAIQDALEVFRNDNGRYPTTTEWLEAVNPLSDYIQVRDLYDPWDRKFHYQAVEVGNSIVSYRLESLGLDTESAYDNIPCPIATEDHSFSKTSGD
ncbi:MAG: type II secretion system protein GspG [Spirochaetaceae bacterium]|nr:MAG: type II secretion system protein GspG [Spirochaetaceae bacterium]